MCVTITELFAYLKEANTAGTNSFFKIIMNICENIFGHISLLCLFWLILAQKMWKFFFLLIRSLYLSAFNCDKKITFDKSAHLKVNLHLLK